jgi:hypothetical protein
MRRPAGPPVRNTWHGQFTCCLAWRLITDVIASENGRSFLAAWFARHEIIGEL